MAFGVWYDDQEQAHVVDNKGQKLSLIDAAAKVRAVLSKRLSDGDLTSDQLVTELVDRFDVNDMIGFLADDEQNFLPEVLPQEGQ